MPPFNERFVIYIQSSSPFLYRINKHCINIAFVRRWKIILCWKIYYCIQYFSTSLFHSIIYRNKPLTIILYSDKCTLINQVKCISSKPLFAFIHGIQLYTEWVHLILVTNYTSDATEDLHNIGHSPNSIVIPNQKGIERDLLKYNEMSFFSSILCLMIALY